MRLNRRLNRRLGSLLTRRTNGRRFRRRNLLAEACRALNLCIRQSKKMARADPHLLGPHARAYYRDVLRRDEQAQLINAALDKVYGPDPDQAARLGSVWQEAYDIPPEQRKVFFKWFRQHYGL
jgi:hypothetical protein